ncbi:hypothetical protein BGZ83_005802 [Gryganskiella cystojenkinii]|nr:hypothetical protein BGZ83_005802 [Gryganskiella cystojenkinii]
MPNLLSWAQRQLKPSFPSSSPPSGTKSKRSSFNNRFLSATIITTTATTNSSTVSKKIPFALTLPEILERILLFLSNHRRRTVAYLVCKQWHAVGCKIGHFPQTPSSKIYFSVHNDTLALIQRQRLTKEEEEQQQFKDNRPSGWKRCEVLTITVTASSSTLRIRNEENEETVAFNAQIQQKASPYLPSPDWLQSLVTILERAQQDRGEFSRVKDLRFTGYLVMTAFGTKILSLFSRTMTILRLDHDLMDGLVDFHQIAIACPDLEELYVEIPPVRNFYGVLPTSGKTATAVQKPNDVFYSKIPTLKRLKVLELEIRYQRRSLMDVILEACPNITALRLAWDEEEDGFNRPDFYQHLAGLYPAKTLESLDLASLGYAMTLREMNRFLELFPDRTQWCYGNPETYVFVRGVEARIECLTELELSSSRTDRLGVVEFEETLHKILCKAPNLIHARCPNVRYDVSHMDVNDVLEFHGGYRRRTLPKGVHQPRNDFLSGVITEDEPRAAAIWVCRNLKTLQILIYAKSEREAEDGEVANGLVIFGYLSRVCPNLEELQLKKQIFHFGFPGGFCLLTRLHNLERLKITTKMMRMQVPRDLNWIRRTPTISPTSWITNSRGMMQIKEMVQPGMVGPDSMCGANQEPFSSPFSSSSPSFSSSAYASSKILSNNGSGSIGKGTNNYNSKVDRRVQWKTSMPNPKDPDLTLLGRPEDLMDWSKHHHERLNGSGDPRPCWPRLEQFEFVTQYIEAEQMYDLERFMKETRREVDFVVDLIPGGWGVY